jgi:hypothetical protein
MWWREKRRESELVAHATAERLHGFLAGETSFGWCDELRRQGHLGRCSKLAVCLGLFPKMGDEDEVGPIQI